jgi:hypothetical protein
MKRGVFVILASIVVAVGLPNTHIQAQTSNAVPPFALHGENGDLSVFAYIGRGQRTNSIPMFGIVPMRVCHLDDCEIFQVNYISTPGVRDSARWLQVLLKVGERFQRRPVTAQVPSNFKDLTDGWSLSTNPVNTWSNPRDWHQQQTSLEPFEVTFWNLDSTIMSRVSLCANYRDGLPLNSSSGAPTSMFGFSSTLEGYTDAEYELIENGQFKKKGEIGSSAASIVVPGCGANSFGPFSTPSGPHIDGLKAGRTYNLTYRVTGDGKPPITTSLDFVAPGACPSGEVILAPSPRVMGYGALGPDGYLLSLIDLGLAKWRFEGLIGKFLGPIYDSASKVGPFGGKFTEIENSNEKWQYLEGVDDWALVLDNATPRTTDDVLENTVFADCSASNLRTQLSLNVDSLSVNEQGCTITNNKIVPIRPGPCLVNAIVSTSNVKKSTARNTRRSTIPVNYVVTTIAKQVQLRNGARVTPRTRAQITQILPATTLLSPSKGARVVRITSRTSSVCRPQGTSLRMLKKGKCRYTATVVRKGKPSTVSSVIRVS